MKNLIVLVLAAVFLTVGSISHSSTVAIAPDSTKIVNLDIYEVGDGNHAQVVITATGNDYITIIDRRGNAFAWGYVRYDYYGNGYLYISDNGYNYYYYCRWN